MNKRPYLAALPNVKKFNNNKKLNATSKKW
jgi:hypothetical protein